MPRRWEETIDAHRHGVRDAILHAAAGLVAERGLLSLTMSEIAERSGIGRATLYRYFPDVEAVLVAWHERQISAHLGQLADVRDRAEPHRRLDAVLEAFALLSHQSHGYHDEDLVGSLHSNEHVTAAFEQVGALICQVIAEGVNSGAVRDDVPPEELAAYCVYSLQAASHLPSKAAVRRLVGVTLDGLRQLP